MEHLAKDWVLRIFERLKEIYKDTWVENNNEVLEESVIAMWQSVLTGVTSQEIKKALELCEASDKRFAPHAIEFWQYCKGHCAPIIKKQDELFYQRSPEIALEHLRAIKQRLKGNVPHRTQ